jgi:hypothetical protein
VRLFWFLLLAFVATAAHAGGPFYVTTDGSDSRDCLTLSSSCRSIQHAVDLAPNAEYSTVIIGPGTWNVGGHVFYYKVVSFVGNSGGGCDPTQTIITLFGGDAAFTFEDHAIGTISCLTINSVGSASVGVITRQLTIADLYYVSFGPMAGGVHVSVNELSKLSYLGGVRVTGSAASHIVVSDGSAVMMAGTTQVDAGLSFGTFGVVANKSLLNGSGGTMSNGSPIYGYSRCADASSMLIEPMNGFPGENGPSC